MAVKQCENGHYYDDTKYESCPHCSKASDGLSSFADEKTVAKVSYDMIREELTQYIDSNGDGKTISIFTKSAGADPVVGWLVCQDGAEKGRDYRLHSGRNFVGRADKMDVIIKDDPEISRENHCSIIYEPKAGSFMLVPGQGTIVFMNGKRLDSPVVMEADSLIEIGSTKFIFIPYCKGDRKW